MQRSFGCYTWLSSESSLGVNNNKRGMTVSSGAQAFGVQKAQLSLDSPFQPSSELLIIGSLNIAKA